MTAVIVTTRDGDRREVTGEDGQVLMELLRAGDFGVAGTCGGMCSCGSCHVYASSAMQAALPSPSEDETDMVEAIGDVVEVRATSRLSCQIKMAPAIDGLELEIAPQF